MYADIFAKAIEIILKAQPVKVTIFFKQKYMPLFSESHIFILYIPYFMKLIMSLYVLKK